MRDLIQITLIMILFVSFGSIETAYKGDIEK